MPLILPRPPWLIVNETATDAPTRQLTVAAENTPIPILYGEDQLGARLLAVKVDEPNNRVVMSLGWCLGEIEGIDQIYFDGTPAPAGVTFTHYLGTPSQGIDPTLQGAIAGYSDTNIITVGGVNVGTAYTVAIIPKGIKAPRNITADLRGLKLYDPRQNRIRQSETYSNSAWGKTRVTVSSPGGNVPTGAAITKLTETTGSGTHLISITESASASTLYRASIWIQSAGRDKGRFTLDGESIDFDLTAVTAGAGHIVSEGSGWYRIDLKATTGGAASSISYQLNILNASGNDSYTGNGSSGFNLGGSLIVQSAESYPYIQTTTAHLTSATAYSTNPALILANFYASTVYGKGQTPNYGSAAKCAVANDESVGGSARRSIGLAIERIASVEQWIETIRTYAACFIDPSGDKPTFIPDRPAPTRRTLTESDIVEGTFRLTRRSGRNVPTVVTVIYTDRTVTPYRDGESDPAKVSGVDAGTVQRREITLRLPGISNHEQAYREAVEQLNTLRLIAEDVEFETYDDAIADHIGDIIAFNISNPIPISGDLYRIMSAEPVHGSGSAWRISAAAHTDLIYSDEVQAGSHVNDTVMPDASTIDGPTSLNATSSTEINIDGTPITALNVTWTAATSIYVDRYQIEWKKSTDINWQHTSIQNTNYSINPVVPSVSYDIRARTASQLVGIYSDWIQDSFTTAGKVGTPPALTSLTATGGVFQIKWEWAFPAGVIDIDYVEIIAGTANDRSLANSLTDAKYPRREYVQTGLSSGASLYAWGRIWDTSGNPSNWYPSSSTNGINGQSSSDANEILSYLAGQIATSHLVQSLNTRIDLIDGPDTLTGSVNKRIQDTKAILDSDITTLQAEVAELSGTPEWSVDDSYITGDLVKFDGGLYSALQDITAPGPDPTNTSYWEKIGDFASLGEAVTAHAAQLTDHETRITDNEGDITAQASQITALQTTVNDPSDGVTANANAIDSLDTRVTTAEGTITSHTSDITALESTVDNPTTGVNANATAVSSLDTRVTTAEGNISTNSSDIVSLENTVNHPSTGVSANASAISVLDGRVDVAEGDISVNASDITALESTVTGLDGDVSANSTAISALDTRVTTAEGTITSHSSDITALENTVNNPTTGVNANSSAITSLDSRVTTAEGTISTHTSDITALESSITGFDDDISANATAITSLDTRVTDAEGDITAQASDITQLQTDVGGNTATIQTQTTSINGLEAQYTVKVDINGRVTGFGFASNANDATPFSEFVVKADRFAIVDPADSGETPSVPFVIQGGQTYIAQAFIGDGWITNAKIGNLIQSTALAGDGQPNWKLDKTGGIDARSITIRDTNGTVILQSGGNLDYTRVGGTKPPSNADRTADNTAAAIAGQGAFATLNQITSSNVSTYIANAAILNAQIGNIIQASATAADGQPTWKLDKTGAIDARSITIRDSNGNIILQSGGNLDYARVGGTKPPSDADKTNYTDTRVANALAELGSITISRVGGGQRDWGVSSVTGLIHIRLPQSWTNTMLRFVIDVFDYAQDKSFSLVVAGHTSTNSNSWVGTSAQLIGNTGANNAVRFGHDGTGCTISIGEIGATWQWLRVHIRDFVAGYSGATISNWDSGWFLYVSNSLTPQRDRYISDSLLDARAILSQGAFATLNQITTSNISTYIASAAIGNAQIGNAAITNAKIGTAAVDTLQIAGQAVTIPFVSINAARELAGSIGQNTWITVHSTNFTSSGAPVSIDAAVVVDGNTGHQWFMRLLRNGSIVHSGDAASGYATTAFAGMSYPFQDTPGSGTHTYALQVMHSTAGTFNTYHRSKILRFIETKR